MTRSRLLVPVTSDGENVLHFPLFVPPVQPCVLRPVYSQLVVSIRERSRFLSPCPVLDVFHLCFLAEQGDPDSPRPRDQGRFDPESEYREKSEGDPNQESGVIQPEETT